MFCSVISAVLCGISAEQVVCEADVSEGMPGFSMVGFVSAQVKEAQDRVKTALRNLGFSLPPKRITINLAPGDLRKDGSRFDLPIAAAVLMALGKFPPEALKDTMVLGELHLDGRVGGVTGVLPSVIKAREIGCQSCLVPLENVREGQVVEGIRVIGIASLQQLLEFLRTGELPDVRTAEEAGKKDACYDVDFGEVCGQEAAKRAAVIAASGFHNLLLAGPPGSGKSMTASRIPTILPPLTREESLEISQIYSVAGLLPTETPLMRLRPFRAPHYTISASALCGGGLYPRPGEITLAHRGVLFLDEIPEMRGRTLELLRQPMEEREILISRSGGNYRYPASFLLVAAMNNCPCGKYPDLDRCTCTPTQIAAYRHRISQPLLERIDLQVQVAAADYDSLAGGSKGGATSAELRAQVEAAMAIQQDRYAHTGITFNSELRSGEIDFYCGRTPEAERFLENAFRRMHLSARSYHRLIRTARTIADLEGAVSIAEVHLAEAICFRSEEGNHV